MDIVYTLKQSSKNEELTYSLRSLVNLPHDKIYFVGGHPSGINMHKIKYIPTPVLDSKYDTTTNNLCVISKLEELSDNFIWMNDDFYILQEIQNPVKELSLHKGFLTSNISEFKSRNGGKLTNYMRGVEHTCEYLKPLGVKLPLDYELHTPFIYNKYNVRSMFNLPGIFTVTSLQPRSVYGNLYTKHSIEHSDCKILRNTIVNYDKLSSWKFLSSSDQTWPKVKDFLSSKFKEKSEYEL